MKYIQLKTKILKLENDIRFSIINNHYKNLSAQIKYSNDWLDCNFVKVVVNIFGVFVVGVCSAFGKFIDAIIKLLGE